MPGAPDLSRGLRVLASAFAVLAFLAGGASPAWAGAGLGVVPDMPSPVSVGRTGVPATLTFVNASVGPATGLLTLSAITLIPSCGGQALQAADCPPAELDPGVLRLSATGTGRAGTACAGITFAITLTDPAADRYAFTPSAPAVLGPAGTPSATCIVEFTVDVLKTPTRDADPAAPGIQTEQAATARGVASDGSQTGAGGGNEVTIAPAATSGTSQGTTTLTPPGGAATPRVAAVFVVRWAWNGSRTALVSLRARNLPRNGELTVGCRGRGCPSGLRRVPARHVERLQRLYRGRSLYAGARVLITVSAPQKSPERVLFLIRRGRAPLGRLA